MQEGMEAVRGMLLELRAHQSRNLAILAGVIETAIPTETAARAEFFAGLADYLTTAMDGATLDPKEL